MQPMMIINVTYDHSWPTCDKVDSISLCLLKLRFFLDFYFSDLSICNRVLPFYDSVGVYW